MKYILVGAIYLAVSAAQVSAEMLREQAVAESRARNTCLEGVDLDDLSRSVVNIFVDKRRSLIPNAATATFLTPTTLITVAHVIKDEFTRYAPNNLIIGDDWYNGVRLRVGNGVDVPLQSGPENFINAPARLLRRIDTGTPEELVLLEVPEGVMEMVGAQAIRQVAFQLPQPDEPVVAIGFPDMYAGGDSSQALTYAVGNYRLPSPEAAAAGDYPALLLPYQYNYYEFISVTYRTKRAVMIPGASGGPIFNCRGEVVGFISDYLTQNYDFRPYGGIVNLPTEPGAPNNAAVFPMDIATLLRE